MFNNLSLVDLASIGFHGAAIAMAILTFQLLRKALEMWGPDVDPEDGAILGRLLKEIRIFMGLCLILFITGVITQFLATPIHQPTTANVIVTPDSWPKDIKNYENLISVKHGKTALGWQAGIIEIQIDNKDNILFSINDLVNEVNRLNQEKKIILTTRTPTGGFGQ